LQNLFKIYSSASVVNEASEDFAQTPAASAAALEAHVKVSSQ